MTESTEQKVYTVEVFYSTQVEGIAEIAKKNFMCFAKNLTEMERFAKKKLGDDFVAINAIQCLEDFTPLTR